MSLFPDPDEMFAIAHRINVHADATRAQATLLRRAVHASGWHGAAASAFHLSTASVTVALAASADRLDDAADALRRHALTVRRELDVLEHLRALGLGLGVDVLDFVHEGLITPVDLLHRAGGALHGLGGALDEGGHLVGHAGAAVGELLGIHL